MTTNTQTTSANPVRWFLIGALVLVAFFVSYQFASARAGQSAAEQATGAYGTQAAYSDPYAAGGDAAACSCCGGGSTEPVEGTTAVAGDLQTIDVDVSTGFAPNVIKAVAGVPLQITFGQGAGCMAEVMSGDLNFYADLTGGPQTIDLPALQPGTYEFSCGMEMVFGQIVVE